MTQFFIVNNNGGPEIISKDKLNQMNMRPNSKGSHSNLMAINGESKLNQMKGYQHSHSYHYGNFFPDINSLYQQSGNNLRRPEEKLKKGQNQLILERLQQKFIMQEKEKKKND